MANVSVVVPMFNEEENAPLLFNEIKTVCEKSSYNYEIIFVDDGSDDKTFENIKNLSPLKIIKLKKNFGQTAAMDAGVHAAKYDYIVTMDGDRQNDPADIPALVHHLEQNDLDVVSGWRKKRKDSFLKKFISRGAHFLRNILVKDNIHDSGCSLKIYKKECFDHLTLFGEMHRFVPALLAIKGYRVGEIEVHHRPRVSGRTKYNWSRMLKGFVDMLSVWFWNKFAMRPLHLLGGSGLFALGLGTLTGVWTVYLYFQGVDLSRNAWMLLTVFFFLAGVQLFVFGLISDMLSKSYYETTKDTPYKIDRIIEKSL